MEITIFLVEELQRILEMDTEKVEVDVRTERSETLEVSERRYDNSHCPNGKTTWEWETDGKRSVISSNQREKPHGYFNGGSWRRIEISNATWAFCTKWRPSQGRGGTTRLTRVVLWPDYDPKEVVENTLRKFLGRKADFGLLNASKDLEEARDWVSENVEEVNPENLSKPVELLAEIHGRKPLLAPFVGETWKWAVDALPCENGYAFDDTYVSSGATAPTREEALQEAKEHVKTLHLQHAEILLFQDQKEVKKTEIGDGVGQGEWRWAVSHPDSDNEFGAGPFKSRDVALEKAEDYVERNDLKRGKIITMYGGDVMESIEI